MHLQTATPRESLSTGHTLEPFLEQMNRLVVPPHVGCSAEDLAAGCLRARDLHAKMLSAIVLHHNKLPGIKLVASGAHARNLNRPLLLVVTNILLDTMFQMLVQELLRGEGCDAGWAGKCRSFMIFSPLERVVCLGVNPELCSIFRAIVDKDLLRR